MTRKFKTESLDVAGFLQAKGLDCKIKNLGTNHNEFIFPESEAEKLAKRFMKGEVVMNLQKFIYSREQVKRRSRLTPITVTHNSIGVKKTISVGDPYYFNHGGATHIATFGNGPKHKERAQQGNVYLTLEEAKSCRK